MSPAAAMVTAVGRPLATSRAKDGPDRMAISAPGTTSFSTSFTSRPVFFSIPLAQITSGVPVAIKGASVRANSARTCAGTTSSKASARAASASAPVACKDFGKETPGRKRAFSFF